MTNHNNCDIDVRLINPDWNIKVYKGNNKAGNRIYFIISSLEPKSLLSTKLIDVEKLYDFSRNEWSLLFTLKSNSNSSLDMFKYMMNCKIYCDK